MTPAAVTAGTPERSVTSLRRAVAAGSIGNALEWYDLTVSFYFSVILAKLFFPKLGDTAGLLVTLGTFGATYLVRPLGAVVLGAYADRAGRKASLMASILLMMIGTFLRAIMPTYATIGVLAPLGILAARLMQGFSVGGEFGSATAFLVERAPDRRGFLASWQWSSQGMSATLGTGFGVLLTSSLSEAQLKSWGWRIPFFFGLLIGPIGFYIRRHIDETPEFLATKKTQTPVRELLTRQWDRALLAVGAVALSTRVNYLIVYMPTYAIKELRLPASTGLLAGFVAGDALDGARACHRPLVGQSWALHHHALGNGADLLVDPARALLSQRVAVAAEHAGGPRRDGPSEGRLQRRAAGLPGGALSDADARHGHVAQLQHRRAALRRLRPRREPRADRAQRQQAGAQRLYHGDGRPERRRTDDRAAASRTAVALLQGEDGSVSSEL